MASGYGLRVQPLTLVQDNEKDCFDKFMMRFNLAVVGSGIDFLSKQERADTEESTEAKRQTEQWRKGAALLNAIGEQGMKVFEEWGIQLEEIRFDDLVRRFKAHFSKKEGIILLRHRFLNTRQSEEEPSTNFISRVIIAANQCQLGDLKDDMIVQVVINGLRNEDLRCKLLTEERIELGAIRTRCEQVELAERTSIAIAGKGIDAVREPPVDSVVAKTQEMAIRKGDPRKKRGETTAKGRQIECYGCGERGHMAYECPRKEQRTQVWTRESEGKRRVVQCYNCKGYGHVASQCASRPRTQPTGRRPRRSIREVEEARSESSEDYAGGISQ